jgi:hypothetical protein
MKQMPTGVLSALYLGTNPAGQQGGVNFVMGSARRGRDKTHAPAVGVFRDDPQNTCCGSGTCRNVPESKPISPFFAVQNKTGSINAVATPSLSVVPLPVGELPARPFVAPTKVVPVVNVKGHRHKVAPQSRLLFQMAQPRLGRRATAAAFRREKLQQRGVTLGTLKHNGICTGTDAGKNTQHQREL